MLWLHQNCELIEKTKENTKNGGFLYRQEKKMVHLYFVIEGEVEFLQGNESFATVGKNEIFGFEDFVYKMKEEKRTELLDREGFFSD